MVIAGLTGGIASGKSTVSAFLEDAGAVIVDADKIARNVVRKGQPAWREIVGAFGRTVLLPDGEINRILLGEIIFNDPVQKRILNRIVHPGVIAETATRLAEIEKNQPDAVVILDVPLLIESGMDSGLSDIIVVYVPEPVQIQRLMTRDTLTQAQALARIRSQMPIEEKKKRATIVIDNSGSREATRNISLTVYQRLKKKIAQQGPS
ncbi:MAG: dephospho-CoA kinase [Deltaproteobacteria bacterium]|nr:dephospho-CoA kinase [Deltaproteobacteria bacterium]